jgi:glycosyltransferase involved in cell wall biosynthesis
MSRSEGWPKAVSEAMWWGCVPVTTPVSCVPWMLGNGSRGELVEHDVKKISRIIESYLSDQSRFDKKSKEAMEWSREYTLESFEKEIKKLVIK